MHGKTKDLGTYYLKVEFLDGTGFIHKWETGNRFCRGTEHESPLGAQHIKPTWEDEEGVFETMVHMFTEGNFSCDCNLALFLARAYQQPEPEETPCAETMALKRLTAIRPNMSEIVLWEA